MEWREVRKEEGRKERMKEGRYIKEGGKVLIKVK
jgi:hypothetical protein